MTLPIYTMAASLVLNLALAVGGWLYVGKLEAETAQAKAAMVTAAGANESNMSVIEAQRGALALCVGQRDAAAKDLARAEAQREVAYTAAQSARAAARAASKAALQSPSCKANGDLPVCPGLVQ